MPKRRRPRSNLYQVDFIAALFGAFLLLWISKPTGSPGEPESVVVVMESNCSDEFSILPEGAERCVGEDVLQFTDPSLKLEACTFKPVFNRQQAVDRFEPDWEEKGSFTDLPAPFTHMLDKKGPFTLHWDKKGPFTDLAPFVLSSKVAGRENLVKFSGLAVVADEPIHKFRAVGYGSSTPPDQVHGVAYTGTAVANVCQQSPCPLNYFRIHDNYRRKNPVQKCNLKLYSRAWPETCLTTKEDFQTGNAATAFDLKPCDK